MSLALCICKASEPADIAIYFKGLATLQMCKDNDKHSLIGATRHLRQIAITDSKTICYESNAEIVVNNVG